MTPSTQRSHSTGQLRFLARGLNPRQRLNGPRNAGEPSYRGTGVARMEAFAAMSKRLMPTP